MLRPRSVEMFQAAPTPYQEMSGVQPNRAQDVMCGAACTYVVSNVVSKKNVAAAPPKVPKTRCEEGARGRAAGAWPQSAVASM